LRVVVIGLGWMARTVWLPRLSADNRFEIVALVDPAQAGNRSFGTVPIRSSLDEVDLARADIAFVLTPNRTHVDLSTRLLGEGISVFLEKPACVTSAEHSRLAAAALASRGRLIVSGAGRYRSDVAALTELVTRGEIGQVRLAELSWVRARGVPDPAGWFVDRAESGGGALLDLGWHLIDIAVSMLQLGRITGAAAAASADFLDQPSHWASWRAQRPAPPARTGEPRDLGLEDSLTALVTTDSGTALSLRFAWASHEAADSTRLILHGSAGKAMLEGTFGFSPYRVRPALRTMHAGVERSIPVPVAEVGAEYSAQLADIPAQLARDGTTEWALHDSGKTIEIIERCYLASGTRRPSPTAA
jgi:oxidoreductase